MSRLTIYPDHAPLTAEFDSANGEEIAAALQRIGVRFERWNAVRSLPKDAHDDDVLEFYRPDIERLQRETPISQWISCAAFPTTRKQRSCAQSS